jgi:PAS domain S-box-containing protein
LLINRELRQSENRYRRITEDLTDYQYSVRVEDGRVVETSQSPACETVTGYTPEEFAADPYLWFQMIAPEDRELVQERIQQVLAGKEIPPIEHRIIRKDGAVRWVYDTTILFKDASGQLLSYEGVIKDITERKQAEEQIKASLREKEVMLQEIHHRVKNNLQVISSLLDMQADTIDDPRLLQAFQDSQQRVRSMALVHEKLYQSADLAHIDFADYVQEMVDYLFMLYSYRARHIIPRLEVDEGFLEIDQAIPCGLIINELVSNALKHAFPPPLTSPPVGGIEGKQPFPTPEIRVAFAAQDGECVLVVGDNGVGLPPELDIETSSSLGLQLVNILVRQLQGSLEIDRHKGATFKLTFPEHQPKRRAITPQP